MRPHDDDFNDLNWAWWQVAIESDDTEPRIYEQVSL